MLVLPPSTEKASVRDDFLDGICEGPGAPGCLMRLAGPLGSGRTTLLGDLTRIAEDEGWQAISISGTGLLRDAVDGLAALSEGSDDGCLPDGLRLCHLLERTAADLNGGGRGLVLLVDDARKAKKDELALLAECMQYEIGKRHDIALVLAGTRESMLACADGAGMGFLSRAKTEDLRVIPEDESAAVSAADGLKERQLLEETSPGCVALAHPFLGIYLLEHAGSLAPAAS